MSESTSARFALPLLAAGQAQKEITHNEALALIDVVLQASVVAIAPDDPPATPALGEAWIVGAAPTAAWAGRAWTIAAWTAGGWRFVGPCEGMTVWSLFDERTVTYRDGYWRIGELRASRVVIDGIDVLGPQRGAIAAPVGGAVVDVEARVAIGSVLAALRDHGLIAS